MPVPDYLNPQKFDAWASARTTAWLLGEPCDPFGLAAGQQPELRDAFTVPDILACLQRVRNLRNKLCEKFIGLEDEEGACLVDWLISAAIARSNVLLIGPPGVAKTALATHFFQLLGLGAPEPGEMNIEALTEPESVADAFNNWIKSTRILRQKNFFFSYMLSEFTQPEELFGAVDIWLLKHGMHARVNHGMLTGGGVRAAFLDEIFKASGSILNTLLTLLNERTYPNWSGMLRADLLMVISASNEMPGAIAARSGGAHGASGTFGNLYAFLDRLEMRLAIPLADSQPAQHVHPGAPPHAGGTDKLSRAFDSAIAEEAHRAFNGIVPAKPCASINDLLLLNRVCLRHRLPPPHGGTVDVSSGTVSIRLRGSERSLPELFAPDSTTKFLFAFLALARDLQSANTDVGMNDLRWTISPRKLKACYKVALAHRLLTDESFAGDRKLLVPLGKQQLKVFNLIWDSPGAAGKLRATVRTAANDKKWELPN